MGLTLKEKLETSNFDHNKMYPVLKLLLAVKTNWVSLSKVPHRYGACTWPGCAPVMLTTVNQWWKLLLFSLELILRILVLWRSANNFLGQDFRCQENLSNNVFEPCQDLRCLENLQIMHLTTAKAQGAQKTLRFLQSDYAKAQGAQKTLRSPISDLVPRT